MWSADGCAKRKIADDVADSLRPRPEPDSIRPHPEADSIGPHPVADGSERYFFSRDFWSAISRFLSEMLTIQLR